MRLIRETEFPGCVICDGEVTDADWCETCLDYHHDLSTGCSSLNCYPKDLLGDPRVKHAMGKDPSLYGDGPGDYKDE